MKPEITEILKRNHVEAFHINEDQATHTINFATSPPANRKLQEEISHVVLAPWKVTFSILPEYWLNQPQVGPTVPDKQFQNKLLKDFNSYPKPKDVMDRATYANELTTFTSRGRAMTKQEYMEFHKSCCDKMMAITKAKNSDYTGESGDPFANFAQIGMLVQAPSIVEIGFITRMSDKLSRIGSFVTKGTLQVKDESVEDTLLDLANYCLLFAGYLRSRKESAK